MIRVITGASWGDENKGNIIDMLSEDCDVAVRYQGGMNAGRVINNDYGKFVLHMLPSAAFNRNCISVIGTGVALDIPRFNQEIETFIKCGVPIPYIKVSDRCQVVMSYHKLLEKLEDERQVREKMGKMRITGKINEETFQDEKTVKKLMLKHHHGIVNLYATKYLNIGFTLSDIFGDDNVIKNRLYTIVPDINFLIREFYKRPECEVLAPQIFREIDWYRDRIRAYVTDVSKFMKDFVRAKKNILFEGQQGVLRDIDYGNYGDNNLQHTLPAYAAIGAGIPPQKIDNITLVTKAYSSRVGDGLMLTEIKGKIASKIKINSIVKAEFNLELDRMRRTGWLDLAELAYSVRVSGATELVMTSIDALSFLDEIKVCVAYKIEGEEVDYYPTYARLREATPIYLTFKGWKTSLKGIETFGKLPIECKEYINYIEGFVGAKIKTIFVGPTKEDVIYRNEE